MSRLIGMRILSSVGLLLVVSVLIFVMQSLIPGNVAEAVAGNNATPAELAQLTREFKLNEPIYQQYWNWLDGILHGTLGSSYLNHQSVAQILDTRAWVTISLVGLATVVAAVIGVALGILSSRGGRIVSKVVDVLSVVGLAIPSFWLALLLISLFSTRLGWFPATGYVSPGTSPSGWVQSLVLPVAALSVWGVTGIAKQTRESMLDVGSQQFVRNLRANGCPERTVVLKHCLRSAAVPILTMVGLMFIGSLTADVAVEVVFALPGLGGLAVSATSTHDIPVIQGVGVYFTLMVIAVNLALDLIYGWVNPKARLR
jgi:peptide/nickel transport system permease protein